MPANVGTEPLLTNLPLYSVVRPGRESTFVNPAEGRFSTMVTFISAGSSRWLRSSDGDRTARRELPVIVREIVNHAPLVDAGYDQTFKLSGAALIWWPTALDDGLPSDGY